MRARYATLPMLAIVLACAFLILGSALDAEATHRGGTGHGEGIDVEYTEGTYNTLLVTLAERPQSEVTVSVISAEDHQTVPMVAAAKLFGIDIPRPLAAGTHTVLLTLTSTGATVAECQLTVGLVSYAHYEPSGGSGEMLPGVSEDGKITLRECTFGAPSGKAFKAWEVNGREYRAGATVQADGDITAKAVWKDGSAPSSGDIDMMLVLGVLMAVIIVLLVAIALILLRRRSR